MNKIKVLEWFGGIGAATQALKRKFGKENIEVVDYVELDKHAVKSYNSINGTNFTPTDINDVDVSNYPEVDVLIAGWPCLLPTTLVKTNKGFIEIKNLKKGDKVKTHTGSWKEVEASWETGQKEIWEIDSQLNKVQTTDNHKWFVLRDGKHQWVRTDELTLEDKMIHEVNNESKDLPFTDEELFILGVYAGDGSILRDGNPKKDYGIELTVSNEQVDDIVERFENAKVYKKSNTDKAKRVHIRDMKLAEAAKFYVGEYSHLKEIHNDIIDLPVERLRHFFDGYMLADGSKDKTRNRYSFTTVSKKMALGLQEIALKIYKVPVNWTERKTHKSLGKRIKYQLDFTTPNTVSKVDKYFYANIRNVKNTNVMETVWDVNVEDDHSFYANNMITHNCQDYSIAGKGLGLDGTRSSLILLTVSKIKLMEHKPKYILLENVKGLISKKHIEDLEYIKTLFDELGYHWDQALLNSKHFGVPQSRERVFMLLTRKDLPKITINHLELKSDIDKVLRDVLDFSEPTQTITLTEMVAYNEANIVEKDKRLWWKLSDGSLREILKLKEPNGTVNVPHSKNFTNNVMGTPDGQMPTIMAGSTRYVLIAKNEYGKGVKMEYENYIYLPPTNPEKPLNNLEGRRLWKTDKYVGTIPAGESPKIYFTNTMPQYNGKTIQLDLEKFNNQDRGKINKVAILGTLKDGGIEPVGSFSKKTKCGVEGQCGTLTTRPDHDNQIIFDEHSFNQKKHFLGVDGVVKTLRAGDCDSENKIAFQSIPFQQDSKFQGVDGQANTLVAQTPDFKNKIAYPEDMVIHYRKLSSLECWRLMGFSDEAHNNCKNDGVSNAQLCKQAGNSIVVNVLEAIFWEVFTKPVEFDINEFF